MFVAIFFAWGLCGGVMAGDLALGHAGHEGAWHLLGDVLLYLSALLVLGLLRHQLEPYRLGLTRWEALAFLGALRCAWRLRSSGSSKGASCACIKCLWPRCSPTIDTPSS